MIVRVRFNRSVSVAGVGEVEFLSADDNVKLELKPFGLHVEVKGCSHATLVPISSVLWMWETEAKPAKAKTK